MLTNNSERALTLIPFLLGDETMRCNKNETAAATAAAAAAGVFPPPGCD